MTCESYRHMFKKKRQPLTTIPGQRNSLPLRHATSSCVQLSTSSPGRERQKEDQLSVQSSWQFDVSPPTASEFGEKKCKTGFTRSRLNDPGNGPTSNGFEPPWPFSGPMAECSSTGGSFGLRFLPPVAQGHVDGRWWKEAGLRADWVGPLAWPLGTH